MTIRGNPVMSEVFAKPLPPPAWLQNREVLNAGK
jgi:hypothetical protein